MDIKDKVDLESLNIKEDKIKKLKEVFPEVVSEDKVDLEKLRLTLGDEVETGKERYGMNWPGKANCFKIIQTPSKATLKPAKEESIDFDTTENLFIEGDNLEVMKLLQSSYYGKVKMIYIDPPYNTGNDFVYPDNYAESLETYLRYTGQKGKEGLKLSTNTETEGRYHSRWMNMMYVRVFLAKNLLKEKGVIFISIDDHEVDNLKKICNEIFGEETFKGQIVRATGQTTGQDSGGLGLSFDYVLIYTKNVDTELAGLPLTDDDLERYEEEDSKGKYALWQLRKTGSNDRRVDRPNMFYGINNPDGFEVLPIGPTGYESCWRFEKKKYLEMEENDYIVWKKRDRDGTEEWWPYVKTYLEGRTKRPSPLWTDIEGNKKASLDLKEIMGSKVFNNPKPVPMIKRLFSITPNLESNDIILDFFAGSATTAHSVLDLNMEDRGNRKFIMVQLQEPTEQDSEAFKAGYKNIAEIGKERIRRVIKKINGENNGKLDLEDRKQDLGFRVFKLDESNFKVWEGEKPKDLVKQLELYKNNVKSDSKSEDILYELILKSGFEISCKIEELAIQGKKVYSIEDGQLMICLEKGLTKELMKKIAEKEPARVVCLDEGFEGNDQLLTNSVEVMKTKGIEFRTV